MSYSDWIQAFVARQPNGFVRGKCADATKEMVLAFPELRRVAGFAHTAWGRDQHWWCVAPDGSVVDPTASQFPFVDYEQVDLSDPAACARVPTGCCMNCGGETFNDDTFCISTCEAATVAYINGGGA